MRETVAQLLPGVARQVVYTTDGSGVKIIEGFESTGALLVAGYDASGALIGIAIEASEKGYADVIRAMYAYSPEKDAIVGFKVMELKETPGLGDKIGIDREFLANFKELDAKLDASGAKLEHPIAAVKHGTKKNKWEVDAISGATISSRAVGRMLNKSASDLLPIIRRNLERFRKGT
jgi:electron transport complex protein RnfG